MRSHLLIGAASSRSGKTTFILGLPHALRNRSLRVQPFKREPDHIDTRHHKMAAGCASMSLDGFMMSEGHVKDLYVRYISSASIAVTEGVMGLFGGYDAVRGSSAEISGSLRVPIVLVMNAKNTAYSVAPLLYGSRNFWKDLNVVRAAFNFMASESHYSFLRQACEDTGMEALDYLPKCTDIEILSRHLRLSLDEDLCFKEFADRIACLVEEHVGINRPLTITVLPERQPVPRVKEAIRTVSRANLNIATTRDPAFNFSYEESIHFLSALDKITYFSPLRDSCLPEADFVYLSGGYPELYLSELSVNSRMRESIHSFAETGGRLLAECGGIMYLCRGIIDMDRSTYPVASVLLQSATMENVKLRLGYQTLCYKNDVLRRHEFHYSRIMPMESPLPSVAKAFTVKGGQTDTPLHRYKNVLAGYVHLY